MHGIQGMQGMQGMQGTVRLMESKGSSGMAYYWVLLCHVREVLSRFTRTHDDPLWHEPVWQLTSTRALSSLPADAKAEEPGLPRGQEYHLSEAHCDCGVTGSQLCDRPLVPWYHTEG